jgi:eukaryotic-like serine/threonine-protein kinase
LNAGNDDDRLLTLAASIVNGTTVDWDAARKAADPQDAAVIDELRVVGDIAKLHGDLQGWGSLTILEPIGEGSAGVVYRAFDADLHRDVALKIVRTASPPGVEPAAVREARRLARIRHRNVVIVYSAEHKEGEVAVAMELIAGKTLDVIVRMHGPFSARETALIGCDVCSALAAIHGAGMLHGDIKAHNVMREDGGRIVVMDFSAGRDLDAAAEAAAGDFAGTPVYIAPEVFRGQVRSPQSDIYSLGVLLFYLATARYPVDGKTRTAVDRHHQDGRRRHHLRDLRPDLPEAFIHAVDCAIAEDPAQRYASAGEFEAALVGTIERRDPRTRRRRAVMWTAAAGALLAGAVAVGYPYLKNTRKNGSNAPRAAAATATNAAAVTSPSAPQYRVDVALYRADAGGSVRLRTGDRLSPGDRLYMQVETSAPAHVYIVNEDDRGASFLLFPLPDQRALNPLSSGRSHDLPHLRANDEKYWVVSSLGAREHFVVFVSLDPLEALAKVFALLPAPTAERAVAAVTLPPDAVGLLRSVGGLTSTPPGTSLDLTSQFPTPLPDRPEMTRGLWVRQITLENSGR